MKKSATRIKLSKFPTLDDVVSNYCSPWDVNPKFPVVSITRKQAGWLADYVWNGMNMDDPSVPGHGDASTMELVWELGELRVWAAEDG